MPALLRRPLVVALLIGIAAQLLFSINLWRPTAPLFDEVHYLPAARALLELSHPANVEHPLLGKLLIALGMAIFGDNSIGWRALSTVAGTASVLGVFAILQLLFRRVEISALGAVLATLNVTLFIQARIAMLDGFMGAFVVLAVAAMLWALRASPPQAKWRWGLGAVLLGLATAVKWTAAPYVAFAALAYLACRRLRPDSFGGLAPAPAIEILGIASIGTYLLTFAPAFFYATDPLTLGQLIPFQLEMFQRQTQVLPAHPYQSNWWTWPFLIRPIWYLYEPVDGAVRGVLLLGNPVVMWGGLAAVLWLTLRGLRTRDAAALGVAGLWIGSLLIWAAIPKSLGFYYYYHLCGLFLCVAIPTALARLSGNGLRPIIWTTLAALAAFVWLYPIISAAPLPDGQAFNQWMIFDSWR